MRALCLTLLFVFTGLQAAEPLRLAVFTADATPEIGMPVAYVKARSITDPLSARGVVLMGEGNPVVLCAVDWIGIGNGGHDEWRRSLAEAAGTTMNRVTVHTLHQHDGVRCDLTAEELLAKHGLGGTRMDAAFCRKVIASTATAVREAMKQAKPLTHLGIGEAKVEKVASNRRILGDNGKIAKMRLSSTKDPVLRELPDGQIDPMLKTICFWNGETKLASLHYYATHPMSFYGDGMVTHDFVGIARERRTKDEGVPHIYFTGCGGNIAAGKYNDGTPESRVRLGEQIYAAMVASEKQMKRAELNRIEWRATPDLFKPDPEFPEERMMKVIENTQTANSTRIAAALRVGFIRHCAAGVPIQLTSLHLGDDVCLLHLPGESFIEYQIFAQQQRVGSFVATASYGDGATGYIPLEKSFAEGGYEPTQAYAAPESEKVMKATIVELLRAK